LTSCVTNTPQVIQPSSFPPTALPNSETVIPPIALPAIQTPAPGKWSLWVNGTQLRGANIYQRRVYPEFDGTDFIGPGPFGPPYTQADFDQLALLGANYVNISGPGLFTIEPPYGVDEEAVANLDHLLGMAEKADLFAVITFRTGPGRSEFAILGPADWLPAKYLVETVWQDADARAAWAEMWRYTAERYHNNPIVVGYDLMCEPNSNGSLDIWDPESFYVQYTGSGNDWNTWYPGLVKAIRAVDKLTPILVGGNDYSSVEWLPYLKPVDDPYMVYTIHQYSPHEYTHQEPLELTRTYPGTFDVNDDGYLETFDHLWLENLLSIAVNFQTSHHVILAVNEFGLERWEPGGADYMRDEMALFDKSGWNYAAWQWHASWLPLAEGDNGFNVFDGFRGKPHHEIELQVRNACRHQCSSSV